MHRRSTIMQRTARNYVEVHFKVPSWAPVGPYTEVAADSQELAETKSNKASAEETKAVAEGDLAVTKKDFQLNFARSL